MRIPALPVLLALPALLQAQRVQAPSAPWRTITTAHYRIHFPAGDGFPTFAQEVASRIEGIHAQYLGLIGHAWAGPVDVLIQDPVREPNGVAVPYPDRPFVVLWRTEPEPDSAIGHHRGWAELLVAHELGHINHLLIPQRGRTFRDWLLGRKVPVTTKSPKWVIEGYATLIEGRLTGSGRPHGAYRAALLRTWAREGQLPGYGELNGGGFLGGNMPYLVGSAYLAWLEQQHPDRPALLQDFWKQLSGPRHRTFDEAFLATFGQSPQAGYARFCAEVTHSALELERRMKVEGVREGEVFTKVGGWVGDLAVSPDGTRLLARVGDPRNPGLRVWELRQEAKAAPKPQPGEPADAPPGVPLVGAKWSLPRIHGFAPRQAAWTADGQGVAFTLRLPNEEGVLVPTSWLWKPGSAPRRTASAPATAPRDPRFDWAPDPEVWNLRRKEGDTTTWLTRTLSAAWAPAPTPDGKAIYYAQLAATGVELRKLDLAQAPLPHAPLPTEGLAFAPDTVRSRPDEPSPLPPPLPPPPAHDYRVGETLKALSTFGATASPSDSGIQIGVGFNDILGRLGGQVLVGEGRGATVRGALAQATWQGSEWEPTLQFFQARQRLSLQRDHPVSGFDRDRRGVAFALDHATLGITTTREHLGLSMERQRSLEGAGSFTRSLADLGLGIGLHRSFGEWGFEASLQARLFLGRTDAQRWQANRGAARLQFLNPLLPVTVRFEEGRLSGSPMPQDRFHLGGITSNLMPKALEANRIAQAALPAFLATGDRFRRWRGELELPFGHAYLEHLAVWDGTSPRPPYQRVAGWELSEEDVSLRQDLLRRLVGRLAFRLGLHRVLDGPTRDQTVGTFTLAIHP
ncbi:MAG: hypothetical protein HYZ13_00300 [Acidobacteria bacterium]|nr:hypothetical protein [Acidobacteriota bacterium]